MKRLSRFSGARSSASVSSSGDGVISIGLPSLLALHRDAESIQLKPQRIRAGLSGNYLSPFKGRGMEFDEVRPYMQGDDARMLDWRVTARTGRAHTKLFREERERAVLLWIDFRSPMFFATQGAFKSVRASQAAAMLGWSTIQRGDRLGALLFSGHTHVELRPRRGKPPLLHLLGKIAEQSAAPKDTAPDDADALSQALSQALLRLRAVAQPGSLLILLSDFSGLDAQSDAHLAQLARHNELMLIDIHDPLEAELPPPGHYRISDGEKFLALSTADAAMRERYRQNFEQRNAHLRRLCERHRMTLVPLATGEVPQQTLQRVLGTRR